MIWVSELERKKNAKKERKKERKKDSCGKGTGGEKCGWSDMERQNTSKAISSRVALNLSFLKIGKSSSHQRQSWRVGLLVLKSKVLFLKTDSGYTGPEEAGVRSPWQTPRISSALAPLGHGRLLASAHSRGLGVRR